MTLNRIIVFIAEGFGAGRIPVAPGTFGTLVGFGWMYLLLLPRSLPIYLGGTIAGLAAAVWIGGLAEKALNKKDPGSIVIDEIAAGFEAHGVVVLDEHDAMSCGAIRCGFGLRRLGRCLDRGQVDDEFAAFARAFAARFDPALVQLDDPPHQRQTDAESALRTIQATLALHE